MPYTESFVSNVSILIRKKRQKLGYTQGRVAKMLGVSTPAYNKKENGLTQLSLRDAYSLCEILGLSIRDFFEALDKDRRETWEQLK